MKAANFAALTAHVLRQGPQSRDGISAPHLSHQTSAQYSPMNLIPPPRTPESSTHHIITTNTNGTTLTPRSRADPESPAAESGIQQQRMMLPGHDLHESHRLSRRTQVSSGRVSEYERDSEQAFTEIGLPESLHDFDPSFYLSFEMMGSPCDERASAPENRRMLHAVEENKRRMPARETFSPGKSTYVSFCEIIVLTSFSSR